MKKLLLTAALVAFAGVAHAELVSDGGLGIQDRSTAGTFQADNNLSVGANADISGNLSVDGDTTLGINHDDDTSVSGGLTVGGNSTTYGSSTTTNNATTYGTTWTGALTVNGGADFNSDCLLYTSPSPRDRQKSRMPSSA